jgi:low temperature requirement protein LtrA
MTTNQRMRVEAAAEGASVTHIELFFDLVFVLALTQVTAYMADHLTAEGLLRGMLIVSLFWWSWVAYAWLGNVVRADEGLVRPVVFTAMAAMFIVALAIPEAFDDMPGGLDGPVVLAVCYFAVHALHVIMFWIAARDDVGLRRQLLRFAPTVLVATALLLVAAGTSGHAQTALWAAALAADYIGTILGGSSGWRLRSVSHFAERHSVIIIVALGESIVAIGVGIAELPISWPIVIGALLGLSVSVSLWWIYFDVTVRMAERALAEATEDERPRFARDAYSYMHLPLIAGIVLLALGLKKTLEYASDTEHYELTDPLTGVGLFALVGGVVIYLVGHVAFKARTQQVLYWPRLVAAGILVVLAPLGAAAPALVTLAVVAAVLFGLVVYETHHHADLRYRIRHEEHRSV